MSTNNHLHIVPGIAENAVPLLSVIDSSLIRLGTLSRSSFESVLLLLKLTLSENITSGVAINVISWSIHFGGHWYSLKSPWDRGLHGTAWGLVSYKQESRSENSFSIFYQCLLLGEILTFLETPTEMTYDDVEERHLRLLKPVYFKGAECAAVHSLVRQKNQPIREFIPWMQTQKTCDYFQRELRGRFIPRIHRTELSK